MQKSILRSVAFPAIDGIRFYAAFAVFLQHFLGALALEYFRIPENTFTYKSPSILLRILFYFTDGTHGVDVFFLISGFLMARIVLAQPAFSYGRFIRNRFKRIYPAFLVSLVLATLTDCLLFKWPWNPVEFAKNLIFLNAVPGLVTWPYNHVTWSLGFEFAFYLMIPALLIVPPLIGKTLAAGLAFLMAFIFVPLDFVRILGLFAGAFIGSMDDAHLKNFAARVPLLLALLAYLACGVAKAVFALPFMDWYYPFLVASAVLFVKVVWDSGNIRHRLFALPVARWLGTVSYSIYLLHSMVISLVLMYLVPRSASAAGALWFFVLSSAFVLIAAFLSYIFVEARYFRSGSHSRVRLTWNERRA